MPKILIKNKKTLFSILFLISFIACLFLANFLSSFLIPTSSSSSSISSSPFEIYFISLSKSQVKNEALSLCPDYQKINAGGYVWEDGGYYRILSSGYLNKNDAVLVQSSLKENFQIESELFSVKFESFSVHGNFDSDEGKVLSKALNLFLETYKSIYDIAVSLDTSVYNEISARMAVNNSHNNLSTTIDNFDTIFSEKSNSLYLLSESLSILKETSMKLCSALNLNNNQTYSSLLKYRYIEMLNIFYNLLKN